LAEGGKLRELKANLSDIEKRLTESLKPDNESADQSLESTPQSQAVKQENSRELDRPKADETGTGIKSPRFSKIRG